MDGFDSWPSLDRQWRTSTSAINFRHQFPINLTNRNRFEPDACGIFAYPVDSMENQNIIQQLLILGLGTTSLVADRLREASDRLVENGELDAEGAKAFVNDAIENLKAEQGNWEQQFERQIRNTLQDLGVPRQAEMDELRGRIDRLERQVRELENKLWESR
jgi:polyhydroxyalkanoate synthesis regulator phasin